MGAERLAGYATAEGTKAYRDRFLSRLAEGHFRESCGLWFSSIGIGSYLGDSDETTDRSYEEALKAALSAGTNVVDTAINYRCQRSERSFGRALRGAVREGGIHREEIIVCTKGGFLPFDGSVPEDPQGYLRRTYIESGLAAPEDVAQGCHAMTPRYLEDQLARSLENLGLETIDIYYLHNPETQLADIDSKTFLGRLGTAFEWLEDKVAEGKIRRYGTATWSGYRAGRGTKGYLSLEELVLAAREAAGPGHHFKVVQLPFNLAMPEAWVLANQPLGPAVTPLLGIAARLDVAVVASAALLQARLTGPLPEFLEPHFPGLRTSAQKCLQFARSVPGMTTALVGMKNKAHVLENLETARVAPLAVDDLILMFQGGN